ncbi:MAG: serine hydrolase [Bacteroidetes bacterium]|nr:serine hydrolase [Bacteroidota bacterium]
MRLRPIPTPRCLFVWVIFVSAAAKAQLPAASFQTNTPKHMSDTLIYSLLKAKSEVFDPLIFGSADRRVQILYTRIDRDKRGRPHFTDHTYRSNSEEYFYPASTVKLPIAVLALQKLNELKIPGLDMNTTMLTDSASPEQTPVLGDRSAADGRPTIAHYIKKILLVSDNDAFNRLYEFLGPDYINETLHRLGYANTEIIHRLSLPLSAEQNRYTNPVRFLDANGNLLYSKPALVSTRQVPPCSIQMGSGYFSRGKLVNEPFDFSVKNRFPLSDLHRVVRSVMFPESLPKNQRFNLTPADLAFLHQYMSMLPAESDDPVYDEKEYWDTYVKFLYYGSERNSYDPNIHVYNKVGDAYGFLIDGAYFHDKKNNIEFLLSAVIYCNSDGIFNDDKYDYDDVGFPFMKEIGRLFHGLRMVER